MRLFQNRRHEEISLHATASGDVAQAARRAASMNPFLPGSALWRGPDSGGTKIPLEPARETLSELLDSGSTASRLDKSGFAGVCPMARP
jgi:hypothetical protein